MTKKYLFLFCILACSSHTFAFQIHFQQPTYLIEKEHIQELYTCDASKSECKVNFAIADDENILLTDSKYICSWNF